MRQRTLALFALLAACTGGDEGVIGDERPLTASASCLDVNGDGFVSPIDALLVINYLNSGQSSAVPPAPESHDTNGDGFVSPIDALLVINYLNGAPPACAATLTDSERCEQGLDRAFAAAVGFASEVATAAGQNISAELSAIDGQWNAVGSSLRAQTINQCLARLDADPAAAAELDCAIEAGSDSEVLGCQGDAIRDLLQMGGPQ